MTRKRLTELRYSNHDIDAISELVALHLRFHTYRLGWSDSAVRRYVRDAGEHLAELNVLTRCDCTTRNERKAAMLSRRMDELEARIATLAAQEELAAIRPELNGEQVMEQLGIPPGPLVGEALTYLMEVRLDEGVIGDDAIRARLQGWYDARSPEAKRTRLRATALPATTSFSSVDSYVAVIVFGLVSIATILLTYVASRRMELRLREHLAGVAAAEAAVRRLLDELPEAVMLLDSEGRVLSANASATELCGIEPTALVRSFFLDLVDAADRDELRASWRRAHGRRDRRAGAGPPRRRRRVGARRGDLPPCSQPRGNRRSRPSG